MERTDLRKELIDFCDWMKENHWPHNYADETEVDEYIKSINSSPSESQSVVDNEETKEDCPSCGTSTKGITYKISKYRCSCGCRWTR